MKEKTYVCRKLYLYYYLTQEGFEPKSTRPDKYDCKKIVWLYDDTPALHEAIEAFYAGAKVTIA